MDPHHQTDDSDLFIGDVCFAIPRDRDGSPPRVRRPGLKHVAISVHPNRFNRAFRPRRLAALDDDEIAIADVKPGDSVIDRNDVATIYDADAIHRITADTPCLPRDARINDRAEWHGEILSVVHPIAVI